VGLTSAELVSRDPGIWGSLSGRQIDFNFTNLVFGHGNDVYGLNFSKLEAVLAVRFWKIET
jgi:hypothetical protein